MGLTLMSAREPGGVYFVCFLYFLCFYVWVEGCEVGLPAVVFGYLWWFFLLFMRRAAGVWHAVTQCLLGAGLVLASCCLGIQYK